MRGLTPPEEELLRQVLSLQRNDPECVFCWKGAEAKYVADDLVVQPMMSRGLLRAEPCKMNTDNVHGTVTEKGLLVLRLADALRNFA